jgi:hypothetical protein
MPSSHHTLIRYSTLRASVAVLCGEQTRARESKIRLDICSFARSCHINCLFFFALLMSSLLAHCLETRLERERRRMVRGRKRTENREREGKEEEEGEDSESFLLTSLHRATQRGTAVAAAYGCRRCAIRWKRLKMSNTQHESETETQNGMSASSSSAGRAASMQAQPKMRAARQKVLYIKFDTIK